jgi:hypothetical protein
MPAAGDQRATATPQAATKCLAQPHASCLLPADQQVDAIRNAAEPYTQSVRRMSHKVTHKVDEYMVKYNLSPAPKPHYR